jgi:hypothetical protein
VNGTTEKRYSVTPSARLGIASNLPIGRGHLFRRNKMKKLKTLLKLVPVVLICAALLAALVSGCENELLEEDASSRLAALILFE